MAQLLGAFERVPKPLSTNTTAACWVLKWNKMDDQWRMQARLVVRVFEDLHASQLSTFAGTTSRWGQRKENRIAAQNWVEPLLGGRQSGVLEGLRVRRGREAQT